MKREQAYVQEKRKFDGNCNDLRDSTEQNVFLNKKFKCKRLTILGQ